jgi:hypothetical protein
MLIDALSIGTTIYLVIRWALTPAPLQTQGGSGGSEALSLISETDVELLSALW